MRTVQKLALLYLFAVVLVFWGYQIGRYEVFPFVYLQRLADFTAGHTLGADTTVVEKLANDAGLTPTRFLWAYPDRAASQTRPLQLDGLKARRQSPRLYLAPADHSGYRVIFGALDFEDALWGGLLLGPAGEALHTWQLSTNHLPGNLYRDEMKDLYGVHLSSDGSVIFSQQESGGGIVKVDACGHILWNLEGHFHHTISPTDHSTFWTFAGAQEDFDHILVEVDSQTGAIIRRIDMADVRRANPLLYIFNLQKNDDVADISHGNDIEPLPVSLAGDFPMFSPGSLLLSYRTQNLVFVLNPQTLEVEWWRIGPWDKQHDPDWEPGGLVTVFSNNEKAKRPFSDIVAIDPVSFATRLLLDGSAYDFYSSINGDHQLTPYGTRMVTSSTQGWAFEVNPEGEVVFSFLNIYASETSKALYLSEAMRLAPNYFDEEFWKSCTGQ